MNKVPTCPLCAGGGNQPGWAGRVSFEGNLFRYLECQECGSQYCNPMPDEELVAKMYGPQYLELTESADPTEPSHGRQNELVTEHLEKLPKGTFLDYGCGAGGGRLLSAQSRGWSVVGVEVSQEIARLVTDSLGLRCFTVQDAEQLGAPLADVGHIGDVVEHLTEPLVQIQTFIKLIKPGGIVLAQGPLEANRNLVAWVLKQRGKRDVDRITEFPPWHVMLASANGQQRFFQLCGLETISFEISEIDWPAPTRLRMAMLKDKRLLVLYLLRRASKAVGKLKIRDWGNRYFYVGRVPEA